MHVKSVLVAFLLAAVTITYARVDLTVEDYAGGSLVVESSLNIVSKHCIFPNDKLFLRRCAKFLSNDGANGPKSKGCKGGIWKLPKAIFEKTKDISLASYISEIDKKIFKNKKKWAQFEYKELCKAQYSLTAARLYLSYLKNKEGITIPRGIKNQYKLCKRFYDVGETAETEEVFTKDAEAVAIKECPAQTTDMAFVVDGSGSVGKENFKNVLKMVKATLDDNISADKTRIAVIKYSNFAKVEIDFGDCEDKDDCKSRIGEISYEGGNTNTAGAIDKAVEILIPNNDRGRVKVMVVITDGVSNDPDATKKAASRAHKKKINVYSIGIGKNEDLDLTELIAIAGKRNCKRYSRLNDFTEVSEFSAELKQESCKAAVNTEPGEKIKTTLGPGERQYYEITVPITLPSLDVQVGVESGGAQVYIAKDTQPNKAVYDFSASASVDQGVSINVELSTSTDDTPSLSARRRRATTSDTDKKVYVTIITSDQSESTTFTMYSGSTFLHTSLVAIIIGLLISLWQL